MKRKFVRTQNHSQFLAGADFMKRKGGDSSCLMLLTGEPGVGKTREVDHWGASINAVFIRGHVGMTLSGLRWSLGQSLGVRNLSGNSTKATFQLSEALRESGQPIIFDEAQYGLAMEHGRTKAAGIEYIRMLCEGAGTFAVLVCHASEAPGFAKFAHISTRIAYNCTLRFADLDDTKKFIGELCEVLVADEVCEAVFNQTSGRFRLIESAITTLESIAAARGIKAVEAEHVMHNGKFMPVVNDCEKTLVAPPRRAATVARIPTPGVSGGKA